jgi:Zn-dependent metalloprotease
LDVFRGKKKLKEVKKPFSESTRIAKNPLTKIPNRVVEINVFPSVLKGGTVRVTKDNVDSTFKEFLKENMTVFKVEPKDLKLVSARKIKGKWYVKYKQNYKKIPVYNAIVSLEASNKGKVNSYASDYHPKIDLPTTPEVELQKAIEVAKKTYSIGVSEKLKETDASLIIYPEKKKGKIIYHLAWRFKLAKEQPDPEVEKFFVVDALDGKIILSYNARFPGARVTGRVQCQVYPENPTDTVATRSCRNQRVKVEFAGSTVTNNSGYFSKTVNIWWSLLPGKECIFHLQGPYVRVQNSNGANYEERRPCNTNNPCNLTWTATDRDAINVFYHMNMFHDWLKDEFGYSWVNSWTNSQRFNARVNYNFNNAYAGNPIQFGTNNFARSSDVIYHECTHNVLYAIYGDYIGWPDAYAESYAMDEGFADYFACSYTNDSRHGEGVGGARDLDNSRKYPGKSTYNIEGHTGGMIIAGAAWDIRKKMRNLLGSSGVRVADALILEAHQILSTYPRDYYFSDPHESNLLLALYKAADDNNNLLDGVPYFTQIHRAFHEHDLLQAILDSEDSFDFSTNIVGALTGGDLYYLDGKFWANNYKQRGVKDLGNIGNVDLADVNVVEGTTGYNRFGVSAVRDHTYVSLAQQGEEGNIIVFRVKSISADNSNVTIQYLYRRPNILWCVRLIEREIANFDTHRTGLGIEGDMRFSEGKFYGDSEGQKGLIDLGDLRNKPIEDVKIPTRGYVRDGLPVVKGHTYVSLYKKGRKGQRTVFRVNSIERKQVTFDVLLKTSA